MPLSWNEIKSRAIAFTKEWKGEASEDLADLYDPNTMSPELVKLIRLWIKPLIFVTAPSLLSMKRSG